MRGEYGTEKKYPMPNSSQFVLPRIVAPASCSSFTTVASKGEVYSVTLVKSLPEQSNQTKGILPFNMADEHVVGNELVAMLSFTAIETLDNRSESSDISEGSRETQTKAFTAAFFSAMVFLCKRL
jgi:hypothetical protein